MNVLIGFEESQTITMLLREKGIEAYSCDLKPAKINAKFHLQMDVFKAIKLKKWNVGIFHPPCTYLTVAGNKWNKPEFENRFPDRKKDKQAGIELFMKIANLEIEKIAIENPIGIMSTLYRKPDQIIQPYYFGDAERKATCLWLKNLPVLKHTKEDNLFEKKTHVKPEIITFKSGKTCSKIHMESLKYDSNIRAEMRSKTFSGIAEAIANQWF